MDFTFNRICDGHPVGHKLDGALNVVAFTPLADEYGEYNASKCILESSNEQGQVVIRLEDNEALGREIRTYLKTDRYLRTRDDGTLPASARRIHRDLAEENRERRERLAHILEGLLAEAEYFAAGQKLAIKSTAPLPALDEAVDYLIKNTFSKMGYLEKISENPLKEIQAILRSDDISQGSLVKLEETNSQALEDLRQYVELSTKVSRQIVVQDLIEKRYALRPYGWPELEVALLIARLLVLGEISLMMDSAVLPGKEPMSP